MNIANKNTIFVRSLRKKASSNTANASGFALIATISVMVLLVMIALAMLSLSTIESRSNRQEKAMAEARANARMALMLAIGELQKELGPDQRINANASLKMTSSTPTDTSRWVGVWDSWKNDQALRPTANFRRWLVAGNETLVTDSATATTPGAVSGETVNLSYVSGTKDVRAKAPLVKSEGGNYSWWVEDEGSKASVEFFENHNTQPSAIYEHFARGQAASGSEYRVVTNLASVPRDDVRLTKTVTHQTLNMLGVDPKDQTSQDHLTVWSKGVLANLRAGGLKKDLSVKLADDKFETELAWNKIPDDGKLDAAENTLYQVNGRGGINFKELHAYYTMPSILSESSPAGATPPGGGSAASTPTLQLKSISEAKSDLHIGYLRPTMISAGYVISLVKVPHIDRKHRLGVVQDLVVMLWNPFDVNLLLKAPTHFTVRSEGLAYDMDITFGSQGRKILRNNQTGIGRISMEFCANKPVLMRPGEVLVMSAAEETLQEGGYTYNTSTYPDGDTGWHNTSGFRRKLNDIRIIGSESMDVEIVPSRFRGSGGVTRTAGIMVFNQLIGTYLESRSNRSIGEGVLAIDAEYGASGNSTLRADSAEGRVLFPSIDVRTLNTGQLSEDEKLPLAFINLRLKAESDTTTKGRYMTRISPSPDNYDYQSFDQSTFLTHPMEVVAEEVTSFFDIPKFGINGSNAYFGASYGAAQGSRHVITNHIPRIPPMSIGALQHALANGKKYTNFGGWGEPQASRSKHDSVLLPHVNHAIGNSYAVPSIAATSTEGTYNLKTAADHSYLANEALWDQWYFSSLAPQVASAWSGFSESKNLTQVFDDFVAGEKLLNKNLLYVGTGQSSEKSRLMSTDAFVDDAELYTAELFLNKGSFNVNSTDVKAWEALLSSSRGSKMVAKGLRGESTRWLDTQNPVNARHISFGNEIVSSDLNNPAGENEWVGFRNLTDDEITEFAQELVKEIRLRGPFLSMADFVNRRLDSDKRLSRMGALQYALDQTVNKQMATGVRSNDSRDEFSRLAPNAPFPDADDGAISTASASYVRQADILTSIGNSLNARSDTFRIRSYGDARSENGDIIATAYCEAVVQRYPEYVDSEDEPSVATDNLTSNANKTYGRKFKIVSFRFLSADEI